MKRMHIAQLLCVLFAIATAASAQNSLSQFVIGGDTAKKIHDTTTINLSTAERITQGCESLAAKEGVAISVSFSITPAITFTCIVWTARAISTLSQRR